MKDIEYIINTKEKLDKDLRQALSTMQRQDTIFKIREKMKENQKECSHFSTKFNWVIVDNICPYCGKNLSEE